jgi:hypothetical protein
VGQGASKLANYDLKSSYVIKGLRIVALLSHRMDHRHVRQEEMRHASPNTSQDSNAQTSFGVKWQISRLLFPPIPSNHSSVDMCSGVKRATCLQLNLKFAITDVSHNP